MLLNISAPRIEDAYAVNSELVEDDGKLLLQVVSIDTRHISVNIDVIFSTLARGNYMFCTVMFYTSLAQK